jgi:hypothetical protein
MSVRQLHLRDAAVLARMAGLLIKLEVLQHVLPLPVLVRRFDARPRPSRRTVDPNRLVWLAEALLRRLYRSRYCMKRSMLLFYFLRKWTYPVRIHFGIAPNDNGDALGGHAWVSLDGEPFHEAGPPESTYTTMFSYPPPCEVTRRTASREEHDSVSPTPANRPKSLSS